MAAQVLSYASKILPDVLNLSNDGIGKDYVYFLSAQLCGGGLGVGNPLSSNPSFKDKLQQENWSNPFFLSSP